MKADEKNEERMSLERQEGEGYAYIPEKVENT